MKTGYSKVTLIGCFGLLLTACGHVFTPGKPSDTTFSQTPVPPIVEIETRPVTSMPTKNLVSKSIHMNQPTLTLFSSNTEFFIEKAKQDLAQRLSIAVTEINLVEAREVVWSDTSLGCPQLGIIYAQVQTGGYIIQLEENSEKYGYHADMDNTFLCEPVSIEKGSQKETDKNVEDGWPNQTKDRDIIIITPTPRK